MKPDPKQLAWMISLIGLGLSATQPTRAETPLWVYAEPVLPPETADALPDPARPMSAWLDEIPTVQVVARAEPAPEGREESEDRLGRFIEQVLEARAAERVEPPPLPRAAAVAAVAVMPPQAHPAPEPLPSVHAPLQMQEATEHTQVVVTNTTDTVLRGLEALIGGAPGPAAPRGDTVEVDTQSQKVLATLAQVLPEPAPAGFGPVAEAERLDQVRGGFTTPNGLQFSFGIERAVYVNGDLVATTTLNLSNLQQDIEQRVADAVGGVVVMPAPAPAASPAPTPAPVPVAAAPVAAPAPAPIQGPPALPVVVAPGPAPAPAAAAGPVLAPAPVPVTAPAPTAAPVPATQPVASAPPTPTPAMVIHTGGPVGVVQIGAGNSAPTQGLGGSAVGTIIQNTLNDQMIQNVMTVNATVNSLQVLKSFDVQSALRSAINDALRR